MKKADIFLAIIIVIYVACTAVPSGAFYQVVQTTVAPFKTSSASIQMINGIPQADQFPGSDPSAKIRAAEVYALANGLPLVDATHFSGTLPCSVDMFGALSTITTPINLVVNLPAAHFQCTVQQTVTNSAFTINGQGPMQTQIEYTNATLTPAALYIHAQTSGVTNGLTDVHVNGIFVYGDNANVTDAVLAVDMNRSEFRNVSTWGATTNGLHCEGCVSTTFYRTRQSQTDALALGIGVNADNTWPQYGWQGDSSSASGNQTTAGSVTDAAAEFTTSAGWWCRSCSSMTFTSGTAEHGLRGIVLSAGSKWNTFISTDLEGNTQNLQGVDVDDLGQSNTYIGLLATSTCSGCASVYANGGAVSYIIEDTGLTTGAAGEFNTFGNNQNFTASEGIMAPWTLEVAANASVAGTLSVPILISTSGSPAFVPGTGITSAACNDPSVSGLGCTSSRGTIKVVNSTATTTTSFLQMNFASTLGSKPSCTVTQQQGANFLGLYVSGVSTSALDIANANTLSGTTTFYISYVCQL